MGSSKSSRILKTFMGKSKKKDETKDQGNQEGSDDSPIPEDIEGLDETRKTKKKGRKGRGGRIRKRKMGKGKKKSTKAQEVTFTNTAISQLSRALEANEWIKLAYALGFVPQGISHFMGRASSSQNSYSQCSLMLRTWRGLTPADEILPRLCNALQRIRRHDLAVKVGLELAARANSVAHRYGRSSNKVSDIPPELLNLISEKPNSLPPSYDTNKLVFTDDKISFLARQILAREEWKRLAYALGFLPDDASQIIASASSSQNLYAQAHLMLEKFREKTPAYELASRLRAAFIRIRRQDLVFLLDLGAIVAPPEDDKETIEEKVRQLQKELKGKESSLGKDLVSKFEHLKV